MPVFDRNCTRALGQRCDIEASRRTARRGDAVDRERRERASVTRRHMNRADLSGRVTEDEQLTADPLPDGMSRTLILGGGAAIRQPEAVKAPVLWAQRVVAGNENREHEILPGDRPS